MSIACSDPGSAGFIGSITGYIDCQAQTLGTGAWAALTMPGSSLTILLTGFLTIFIALIGYRLLLGSSFTVRETTLAFVKIGAVFALATNWPAYRTLVYDVVTDGPSQLASEIGIRGGVPGADGTLVQRLDGADAGLVRLAIIGPGMAPANAYDNVPPPPFSGFDSFALGGSRILFLMTAIGGLGIVRIVSGLLLALGPFFIAFLLFDGTRSLFEGWVRVLGGVALGAVAVSIALGLELGLLEPWLSAALSRRMAGEALPTMPTELFTIITLFALFVAGALYAVLRLTYAFRLPPPFRLAWAASPQREQRDGKSRPRPATEVRHADRSRAAVMASMLSNTTTREQLAITGTTGPSNWGERSSKVTNSSSEQAIQRSPLGRSHSRRPGARVSAIATKRDLGA